MTQLDEDSAATEAESNQLRNISTIYMQVGNISAICYLTKGSDLSSWKMIWAHLFITAQLESANDI